MYAVWRHGVVVMARRTRDARLDTRTARLKLVVRREPHWKTMQEGRAIGYRRMSGKAGTWVARRYDPAGGRSYQALGTADDYVEADRMAGVMTFAQAQAAALDWFGKADRAGGRIIEPITVAQALDAYLTDYVARGGKAVGATAQAIKAHIAPALGGVLVDALTPARLRQWHHALATAPARVRGVAKPNAHLDADAKRARRATANRILTILKAALNLAFRDGNATSDDAWRRVQPFAKVDAPRIRFLTDDESRRLMNACPADFRLLVSAALLTGARYGELVSLTVGSVDLDAGAVTIRVSKSGKPRAVWLTDEARAFFGRAVVGKPSDALVFTHANGTAWGKSHQFRPLLEACAAAGIVPAVSFHVLRHTHATRLVMNNASMSVIAAQLGNAEAICAKHYAHLSPGYVANAVRAAFGPLGVNTESNVLPLRHGKAPRVC
jgi:integrase